MLSTSEITAVALVGIGATAVMDAWLVALSRLGVPTTSMALIGRWVGHLARGRIAHEAIAKSPAVPGELALGWITHYAVGIAWAVLLDLLTRTSWITAPTWGPAIAVGVATVAFPLLVMQPAMGAGFLAMKTKTPLRNVLRSLANHAVFGGGLYLAALVLGWATR